MTEISFSSYHCSKYVLTAHQNLIFLPAVISAEVLAWIILDNTFLKPYTTYLFTPYLVIIWTLVGIVYEIWNFDEPVFLFAGSIFILIVGKSFWLNYYNWFERERNYNK